MSWKITPKGVVQKMGSSADKGQKKLSNLLTDFSFTPIYTALDGMKLITKKRPVAVSI